MPLYLLDEDLWFPPVDQAEPDGLLALGGDLNPERLLLAYHSGIFPWYSEDVPLWWCPDPRFVLFPEKIKISKSMRQLLHRNAFVFTINKAFTEVITACSSTPRIGQDGTWISDDIVKAYTELHQMGYAHSAEVWLNEKLVGGLYGIKIGKAFFGESMFSHTNNASKYAFIKYTKQLQQEGVLLIDCQVHTSHLESLGAEMIPRTKFINLVDTLCNNSNGEENV
jgi:leucyl/phenylalanyl-tRNA---protein transferase